MEIELTAVDSAKRIVELEAQRDQLREENAKLKAREERIKERFDSEERNWREEDGIRAKRSTTEMEKRKLEIVELEAQRDQLMEENAKLKTREVRLKERFDSEETKWREEEDEIRAKCWSTELEKRKLEIELKQAQAVRRTTDDDSPGLLAKLKAAEDAIRSLEEERAMDAEKQLKLEDKILELTESVKALEEEKRKLGGAQSQENRSQREEIERIWNESKKKVSEMAHRIQVSNVERREMAEEIKRLLNVKAEHEKINSEHVLRVEALVRDKLRLEMEKRSQREDIERISNESNNKVLEMGHRIEILNNEKRKMAEEIKEILNVKADYEKRVAFLERDKPILEMVKSNMDQVIKGFVQRQNHCSAANKKTMGIPQPVHPVSNVGISGTPAPPYQGEKLKASANPAYRNLSWKKKGIGKAAKDPNNPKRPPSAFFVFMEEFRVIFKEKHPYNKCVAVVGKAAGEKWKEMSEAVTHTPDKAPFNEKAEKRKREYEKSMAAYCKKQKQGAEESDKSTSKVHDD